MKIALTIVFVLFFVFLVVNRERLYVRDPAARVYRSSVKQSDVQVFINYSADVLLEKDTLPNPYRVLVQDWDRAPGTPITLSCIRWVACMTAQDNAPILPLHGPGPGKYDPNVLMSDHVVSFVNGDGAQMIVELR
jgi:hypothetical protein